VARAPWHVLVIRQVDRVGKGIRSSPRDAIIAGVTPPDRRGAAYGFHRAMDHAGALVGPLVAYALVALLALEHRAIFALAAIPGIAAVVVLVLFVREAPREALPAAGGPSPPRPPLPRRFLAFVACLALFTLGRGSDLFVLLRAVDAGVPATAAPLLWALLHAGKAALAAPLGALSDRLGRRRVIVAGWALFAATFLGFAAASAPWHVWALFGVYAGYFALSEGAEKALVVDLAPAEARGRAFGVFHFTQGMCLLPASLLFGVLWERVGHGAAFVVSATVTLAATAALAVVMRR
jgi:MFS family permease